jgi:HK97 family phage prohead protease
MEIKTLCHGGYVSEVKTRDRNGVPVGVVSGYIATWDIDRGDWSGIRDKFLPGAFLESIERHKKTDRQVRLKDQHGRTVGGFPIETVREDSTGLFGIGEINLEVQQGAEAFSLAKQKVLTDFSIGWEMLSDPAIVDGVRHISKAEIWEGSIVDEPMNPFANILDVKTIDFSEIDPDDIRGLEDALKKGVKFSARNAKKIISAMKSCGMLRDEQAERRDGELLKTADSILNLLYRSETKCLN